MFASRFLAFLFIIAPTFAINECSNFIDKLEQNQNTPNLQSREEQGYFAYSGIKGMNHLGRRRKCEEDSARKYYVIGEITPAIPGSDSKAYVEVETGICVPNYCDQQSLESHSTLLRLCRINNWNPTDGTLVLNDLDATPPRGAGFYVLVALFYILIATCIFSTLFQNRATIWKMLKKDEMKPARANNFSWFFKAFDAVANLKSFYKTAQESGQSDQLAIFGILRTCSMLWVATYHTINRYRNMFIASGEWPASPPFALDFFYHGSTAVGIFFWMAGFLAAFTLSMKAAREKITICKFFSDMFHRLVKIYPGYWVAVFLEWIIVPGMMKGTLANRMRGQAPICGDRWVQKFFMVDNLIDQPFRYCAIWTWYLDADIHLYIVVILLAYLFVAKPNSKRMRSLTYLAIVILAGLSIGSGFYMIYMSPGNKWYYFTLPRGIHVLIGVFFGLQYYEYSKLKLTSNFCAWCEKSSIFRFISMIIGLILMIVGVVTFKNDGKESEFGNGILISLGSALFFVPLANNCTSIIKQFFNLRIFQVFGKLGMGFYLVHFLFVYAAVFTVEDLQVEYSFDITIYAIQKVILYAYLSAFLYYFILEKPLLNIEAHFLRRKRPTKLEQPTPGAKQQIFSEPPRLPLDKGQQVSQDMEAGAKSENFPEVSDPLTPNLEKEKLVNQDIVNEK